MDYLPFNLFSVVVSGGATIASTAVKHAFRRKSSLGTKVVAARGSLAYDEAFCVVKDFLEKSSLHKIEDIQTFGNNFLPSPYWIRVIRVVITLSTRLEAGRLLIDTFGEQEIEETIGGKEWWQCTAHRENGVDGEWISMKRDWHGLEGDEGEGSIRAGKGAKGKTSKEAEEREREKVKQLKREAKLREDKRWREGKEQEKRDQELEEGGAGEGWQDDQGATAKGKETPAREGSKIDADEDHYSADLDEMRCLLYLHGGAYFWGSTNSHRYVIWRMARKMGGRAFAINYRLAPQYPFPCGLHDALAAYLYLIRPPPGAKHRPVDPAKITIAGDSAGGGMSLALLCLIRDSGLPPPAGAMLISPWCDLTHSMPSLLENTKTDIVPPYGFLFKPSTLWPPPSDEFQIRAQESTSVDGLRKRAAEYQSHSNQASSSSSKHHGLHLHSASERKKEDLAERVLSATGDDDPQRAENGHGHDNTDSPTEDQHGQSKAEPARRIRVKIDGVEVELKDQIQCYATNEQLAHPFVSPAWQPSLGGLPPLWIMAGDGEVLRDEIVYMAHRAAHPDRYPVRQALLDFNPERTAKTRDLPPTKVHLQIYDDACHVLPLFSFVGQAKYAYRAMASFGKWVTEDKVDSTPAQVETPAATENGETKSTEDAPKAEGGTPAPADVNGTNETLVSSSTPSEGTTAKDDTLNRKPSRRFFDSLKTKSPPPPPVNAGQKDTLPHRTSFPVAGTKTKLTKNLDKTIYTALDPFRRPPFVDNMVRERVAVDGTVRPLEPESEMKIFKLDPEDLGIIKEAPAKRYLAGKKIWDKRFARTQRKVDERREYHLRESMKEEAIRLDKHFKSSSSSSKDHAGKGEQAGSLLGAGKDAPRGRRTDSPEPFEEGMWSLGGERPPPSSIAARKDTREARKLAKLVDEQYSKMNAMLFLGEMHKVATTATDTNEPTKQHSL